MIKGDINNVLQWLDVNGILQWTVFQGSGSAGQGKIFESNIEMPQETEVDRFKTVMALSENTLVKIVGKTNPKQQTGVFVETWSNVSAAPTHSIGAAPVMDADYIDKKIAAAVHEERLMWREKELAKRESSLADAEKEFKRNQEGIVGILIEKAAPFISKLVPRTAVAGVQTSTPVDPIPVREVVSGTESQDDVAGGTSSDVFADDEADRLFNAMTRYKEADPEYLEVLESFINTVTSGEPFSVYGMKVDYTTIKNVILKR